jgi:multidrug efflux system outer membrane protein
MKRKIILFVGLLLLLSGCASVGPDYKKPDLIMDSGWNESGQGAQVLEQAPIESAWWKNLNDPVLDNLMTEAVNANLDLKQARARLRDVRSQTKVAGAAALPQVGLSGSFNRSQSSFTTDSNSGGNGLVTLFSTGFDANWEIGIFGGTRRSVEASQADAAAATEDVNATLHTLLGDVARNYVELRAFQQQIAVTRQNADAQRSTVELTQKRYEAGLASYLDVTEAQSLLATTESSIPPLGSAAKQSIHHLGILLGKGPNVLKTLLEKPTPIPNAPPVGPLGVPSDLLTRRPDVRRAERLLAATSARIGVATAELFPKFNITAALGLASASTGNLFQDASRQWSLLPGLTLPIFSGGKITADIESKKALFEEALLRYQDTFNKALEEVENALVALSSGEKRREALHKAVESNQLTVELAGTRYKAGLTAFLDVLTAQRSLYTVQVSLSQSQAALTTSYIALYKALGGGWQVFKEK